MVLYTCIMNWSRLALHDLYIVNLALCDVLVPVFAFPLTTISSFCHRWVFLETGKSLFATFIFVFEWCEIYGFLCFFFGVVSIVTLTEMALVRYTIICRPAFERDCSKQTGAALSRVSVYERRASTNMTCKRKSRALLILPYIYGALWSAIPFVGYGSYEVESYGISCSLHWADNRVFTTLVSVCCIGLPAGCIVMAYGSILSASKRSRSKVKEHQKILTNTQRKREAYLTKVS
ncbi:OPN5-like protein [Mya arenaria]|uniref:OPN5-like protein n=1 Tax=Mya arenaria TaxID=6604 RepID=A0ABY7G6G7_MYAAR|nr:OPN5-like protein [Mya arenaria]